jgi:[acyl-carrier-protein] S-malonyltransferase
MNKRAFIFPGQGAQCVGMGKDFCEAYGVARYIFEEASDVLSEDIKELVFAGPAERLAETKYSQTAIFVTSVAILRVVQKEFPELVPAICAGLSLGEYTALFAAGKISFQECLRLVAARGAYMQEACQERKGGMRVVLGLDAESVQKNLPADVWIANLNCPGQVVIAGAVDALALAEETLKGVGAKRVLPLDVSGAFHTPLMRSAQVKLQPQLQSATLKESYTQFVMNVPGDFVSSLPEIRSNLIQQVACVTRWEQAIRTIDESDVGLYIEMGPGKTLAGMNKKIGVKAPTVSIEKITDLELINEAAQR